MAYKTFHPNPFSNTIWVLASSLLFNNYANSYPTNSTTEANSSNIKPSAGNLKFTFGPGGVPEAFFQELGVRQAPTESSRNASSGNNYNLCQNGSGGLCVPKGDCPADLKPQDSNAPAVLNDTVCPADYECCYGYPSYERSCRLRGGGCVLISECGNAPKFRDDAECDSEKNEICCILTI